MTSFFKQAHTNVHVSTHAVLGSNMRDEAGAGQEVIYLAAGCFWGVEKALWNAPGVVTTATGYMGGDSPNPTYEQVCSHSTGHAETVRVVFDTALASAADLLRLFFEIHDPTQVGGQGNDIGDQYRSAIWTTTPEQLRDATALRAAYQEVLTERGFGPIQTVSPPLPMLIPPHVSGTRRTITSSTCSRTRAATSATPVRASPARLSPASSRCVTQMWGGPTRLCRSAPHRVRSVHAQDVCDEHEGRATGDAGLRDAASAVASSEGMDEQDAVATRLPTRPSSQPGMTIPTPIWKDRAPPRSKELSKSTSEPKTAP